MSLIVVSLFGLALFIALALLGLMIWVMEDPRRDEEHPPKSYPR